MTRAVVGIAALVAVGALGLTGCTSTPGKAAETPPGTTASSTFEPHPLDEAAARSMETAVVSGQASRVAQALSVPKGQKLDPSLISNLRGLAPLRVDESTFQQIDAETATVIIHAGGTAPKDWRATLVLESGTWHIALTSEAGS